MAVPVQRAQNDLETAVRRVRDQARAFTRLTIDERIALLRAVRRGYHAISEESVIAACRAKGIDPTHTRAGEEWLLGPVITIRNIRLLEHALHEVKRHGVPRIPRSSLRTLPDGRLAVKVYPTNRLDQVLLSNHVAEAYMQPGVTAENLSQFQATFYKKPHDGRVCGVLGAGNANSIAPTDALYKMFVEGAVCVLKMNPVNEYLGPLIERAFAPLIERGFFAVVYGGADVGQALAEHPLVDELHMTGSDKTFDALVWGPPGPEREERIRNRRPRITKRFTSELGNISPAIVIPGPYTDEELKFQARNLAGMVTYNASFNCTSAKVLVTAKDWDRREALIQAIEHWFQREQPRRAYYPGAVERFHRLVSRRKDVRMTGEPAHPEELPYALVPDVDPTAHDDPAFSEESWCTLFAETRLEGRDPIEFFQRAVEFVNERVWGTLAANVLVHPKTIADAEASAAFERSLEQLRYGTVVVNSWAGAVFGLGTTPWGAHPSSPQHDIQSGSGWVHNTLMLEQIEKTVLRAPVKSFPIPPWFPGHRTLDTLARRLLEFEMDPSWSRIPAIAAAAIRG